jgi:type I restriction-modification system DNA methylase subunit
MTTSTRNPFTTIHTEGALLPVDLLQRIVAGDSTLGGLDSENYHLPGTEKLNEAINRSWNRLLGAWATFQTSRGRLGEGDAGTSLTRERWLMPLFQELGYGRLQAAKPVTLEGKEYRVSHAWGEAPIHLVGCGVNLDRRQSGVTGASKSSPHSLVQEFLNRNPNQLWGMLSNGLTLRVLRDNASLTRQAYLEFDLEAMLTGEVYADFVVLWLVCHQSRVETRDGKPESCWLEIWSKTAQEQGIRALDKLRDGVEQAITSLGVGFLAYPGNTALKSRLRSGALTREGYYRQLLRLVYRLIFLFAAEDRDLLLDQQASPVARERYMKYYSATHLRQLAEQSRGGRHPDLYATLQLVSTILGGREQTGIGLKGLGLPVLGSFLFSGEALPDLETAELENSALLSAVRGLAFVLDGNTRRSVDYRNLGTRELGSVYESLLELHPQINIDAGVFQLSSVTGNERKTTGSYYTPEDLIKALLDSALDPVILQAIQSAGPSVEAQIAALLALKVCDPACGSGHFLIAAARRIARRLAQLRSGDEEPSPEVTRAALRHVIRHCVYGVDINPMAVELCIVNLWLESLDPGKPLSFLDMHIKCGNSIVGLDFNTNLDELVVPDEAFNPIAKKDRPTANLLKKRNKSEREGQESLFVMAIDSNDNLEQEHWLAEQTRSLNVMPDDNAMEVKAIEDAYHQVNESTQYRRQRQIADLWTSAFFWEVDVPLNGNIEVIAPTNGQLRRLINGRQTQNGLVDKANNLRQEERFFHWPIEFADVGSTGGFDCVVGNPPYIQLQTMHEKADMLQGLGFETFARMGDIYCLFYERGVQLLREKGILAFITSNKWMRAEYGEALRKFLAENTNPLLLVDFAGQKIFKAATVDVNLLALEKARNKYSTKSCVITDEASLNNLSVFIEQHAAINQFNTQQSWTILSNIEQSIKAKVEEIGVPLKDWNISINRGILTGFNEAFIITGDKRKELISLDPKSAEIIRPILRGRDIKRYGYQFADLYLICTFPSKNYDIKNFPAIKNHLLSFGFERLEQSGKSYIINGERVSARKKTSNKWFETQDSIGYWDDFNKQKIVWGNLSLSAQFAMAEEGIFVNAPASMIVPGSEYMLAVLNSKIADFYIRNLGVTRNGGYFEYKPMFVEKLPVPQISESAKETFVSIINDVLQQRKAGKASTQEEDECDNLIFGLYGLTNREVKYLRHYDDLQ